MMLARIFSTILTSLKGTDMGLTDIHNFIRRTGSDKLAHHFAAIVFGIFDLAIEFAIGKSTGTTLTKLHV